MVLLLERPLFSMFFPKSTFKKKQLNRINTLSLGNVKKSFITIKNQPKFKFKKNITNNIMKFPQMHQPISMVQLGLEDLSSDLDADIFFKNLISFFKKSTPELTTRDVKTELKFIYTHVASALSSLRDENTNLFYDLSLEDIISSVFRDDSVQMLFDNYPQYAEVIETVVRWVVKNEQKLVTKEYASMMGAKNVLETGVAQEEKAIKLEKAPRKKAVFRFERLKKSERIHSLFKGRKLRAKVYTESRTDSPGRKTYVKKIDDFNNYFIETVVETIRLDMDPRLARMLNSALESYVISTNPDLDKSDIQGVQKQVHITLLIQNIIDMVHRGDSAEKSNSAIQLLLLYGYSTFSVLRPYLQGLAKQNPAIAPFIPNDGQTVKLRDPETNKFFAALIGAPKGITVIVDGLHQAAIIKFVEDFYKFAEKVQLFKSKKLPVLLEKQLLTVLLKEPGKDISRIEEIEKEEEVIVIKRPEGTVFKEVIEEDIPEKKIQELPEEEEKKPLPEKFEEIKIISDKPPEEKSYLEEQKIKAEKMFKRFQKQAEEELKKLEKENKQKIHDKLVLDLSVEMLKDIAEKQEFQRKQELSSLQETVENIQKQTEENKSKLLKLKQQIETIQKDRQELRHDVEEAEKYTEQFKEQIPEDIPKEKKELFEKQLNEQKLILEELQKRETKKRNKQQELLAEQEETRKEQERLAQEEEFLQKRIDEIQAELTELEKEGLVTKEITRRESEIEERSTYAKAMLDKKKEAELKRKEQETQILEFEQKKRDLEKVIEKGFAEVDEYIEEMLEELKKEKEEKILEVSPKLERLKEFLGRKEEVTEKIKKLSEQPQKAVELIKFEIQDPRVQDIFKEKIEQVLPEKLKRLTDVPDEPLKPSPLALPDRPEIMPDEPPEVSKIDIKKLVRQQQFEMKQAVKFLSEIAKTEEFLPVRYSSNLTQDTWQRLSERERGLVLPEYDTIILVVDSEGNVVAELRKNDDGVYIKFSEEGFQKFFKTAKKLGHKKNMQEFLESGEFSRGDLKNIEAREREAISGEKQIKRIGIKELLYLLSLLLKLKELHEEEDPSTQELRRTREEDEPEEEIEEKKKKIFDAFKKFAPMKYMPSTQKFAPPRGSEQRAFEKEKQYQPREKKVLPKKLSVHPPSTKRAPERNYPSDTITSGPKYIPSYTPTGDGAPGIGAPTGVAPGVTHETGEGLPVRARKPLLWALLFALLSMVAEVIRRRYMRK